MVQYLIHEANPPFHLTPILPSLLTALYFILLVSIILSKCMLCTIGFTKSNESVLCYRFLSIPPKIPDKLWFSVIRRYRKRTVAWNGLTKLKIYSTWSYFTWNCMILQIFFQSFVFTKTKRFSDPISAFQKRRYFSWT